MFCTDGSRELLNCKDVSFYISLTLVTSLSPGLNYESFPARPWPCPLSTHLCSILMAPTHVKQSSAQSIASSHSHTLISTHGLSFFSDSPLLGSFSTLMEQFSIGPYGASEGRLFEELGIIFLTLHSYSLHMQSVNMASCCIITFSELKHSFSESDFLVFQI